MVSDTPGVCIVPKLKKGQLVRVRQGVVGIRATTAAERDVWYEKFHADCRAGRDVPYDSGGEPRLAPDCTEASFSVGKCFTVTSAAASYRRIGKSWWQSPRGGLCLVLDTVTGQEWMVAKRYLEVL
jgi:hypothetical protein